MKEISFKSEPKKKSKWFFLFKVVIGTVLLMALLFFVMSIFKTEEQVNSLNTFLSEGYLYFLPFRLVIYGAVVYVGFKMRTKIKATTYYKTFVRTSVVCIVYVLFNEIMLYIRLMG